MTLTIWNTRAPLDPAFARAWDERLAGATQANYSMRLDALQWGARAGHHALAARIDEGDLRAAIVLRDEGGTWVSGWPWRWQAAVEGDGAAGGFLDAAACARLFDAAERLAAGRRLCCHLPVPPPPGCAGFVSGLTLVRRLDLDDEALLQSMDSDKRRVLKRARKEGLEVVDAAGHDQFRAFAELQVETENRRGMRSAPPPLDPAPGQSWREWEHPWMRLLVAVREGKVVAGSGFGWQPRGMIDYRTNASTVEAKKIGANVLLAFEAMRRAREAGLHWVNWGGDTVFKRQLGGVPVAIGCRLGGGFAWVVPNHVQATLQRVRPRIAALWRSVHARPEASSR